MIYEGVTFVEAEVKKMGEQDFVKTMLPVFWQDRDEATRKKMLADVYSRITGKGKRKK